MKYRRNITNSEINYTNLVLLALISASALILAISFSMKEIQKRQDQYDHNCRKAHLACGK